MEIVEPTKEQLDSFVIKNGGDFQQSWKWGEFEASSGHEIKRITLVDGGRPLLVASFFKFALPANKFYWICPGGPLLDSDLNGTPAAQSVFVELAEYIKKELGGIFARIEPRLPASSRSMLVAGRFKKAPKDHSPKATTVVDLADIDKSLTQMHQKTRYNIRLAEKKGVSVEQTDEVGEFIKLLKKTSKRDKFHLHSDEHYQALAGIPEVKLFMAYHNHKPVAGAIVSFFGREASYLHGASDYEARQVMAPYLLHFDIMKQAQKLGMTHYDLRGVAPESEANHPWAGITRFKKGFGGRYVEYAGSYDYVLKPFWYQLYKIARKVL